jgi:hypothetical protein
MALSQTNRQDLDGAIFTNLQDVNGNGITSTNNGGKQSIDVNVTSAIDVSLSSTTDSVEVLQDNHDDLNANANIQVGNIDVSNANPVPVSDAGSSITVDAVDLDIRDLSSSTDSVSAVVTSSVLPTGAATETTLSSINSKLSPSSASLFQFVAATYGTTSFTLLAADVNRKGFIIYNNTNKPLNIAFSNLAAASAFTVKINANAAYENPTGVYTGIISAIFPVLATGDVQVTVLS